MSARIIIYNYLNLNVVTYTLWLNKHTHDVARKTYALARKNYALAHEM